jgi:hypothetical protein
MAQCLAQTGAVLQDAALQVFCQCSSNLSDQNKRTLIAHVSLVTLQAHLQVGQDELRTWT